MSIYSIKKKGEVMNFFITPISFVIEAALILLRFIAKKTENIWDDKIVTALELLKAVLLWGKK